MLDNVDATLESAIASHEEGDLIIAGEKYIEILKVEPNHPDANHNFGLLTVKLGEPGLGVQFLKNAIESNPTVKEFWISIISTLIDIEDIENASSTLKQAREVGHIDDVFDKLASNLKLLKAEKKKKEER